MPVYWVEILVTTTTRRQAFIEADSEEQAQLRAYEDDWRTWELVGEDANAHIDFVEEI